MLANNNFQAAIVVLIWYNLTAKNNNIKPMINTKKAAIGVKINCPV